MREQKVSHLLLLHYGNPVPDVLSLAEDIVIAPYECKSTGREMAHDLTHDFPIVIVHTVKQVTKEIGVLRVPGIHEVDEKFGIPDVGAQRNGQSGAPKMIHFSKMQVGNNQGLQIRNPECPLREQKHVQDPVGQNYGATRLSFRSFHSHHHKGASKNVNVRVLLLL